MAQRGVITGHISVAGEAVLLLTIHGKAGRRFEFHTVIDTGYNGQVSLPPQVIHDLGLGWIREDLGTLADGSRTRFDVYRATLFWLGRPRLIRVDAMDSPPTIGTELLHGHTLHAAWIPGGLVTIAPLSES